MIVTVVSSLILMQARMMMEVFPPGLRKLWKEWELRAMVFVSLTSQIVLIGLGNRRKYIHRTWIKAIVWSAYLLADSVATIALGILLNDLGEIYQHDGHPDNNIELTAFWAPFFLLHLGGPDTITAYSLEDNELFLRHAFQLILQTLATILIFFTAWNGSRPSILAIPMIIVGFIKYAERTWTLWSASSDRLRDSMLSPPEAGPNYPKFMDEYCLKHAEGYMLETEEMADPPAVKMDTPEPGAQFTSDDNIKHAHALFRTFKCLFADLILSNQERETCQTLLERMPYNDVFDVIAIELGFMYDLLYTKATVNHTAWGLAGRVVTSFLTCLVLVIFSFADKQKYLKIDIHITLLLLAIAIALEIYAFLVLLFSDQSRNWFIEHKKTTILKPILFLDPRFKLPRFLERIFKPSRWSNCMVQFSFTRFCLKEEPGNKILRLLRLDKLLEKHRYKAYIHEVPEELKAQIFIHVKDKLQQYEEEAGKNTNLKGLNTRGSRVIEKYNNLMPSSLEWSVNKDVEFDQSILIWHIATELCRHYSDTKDSISDDIKTNCDMSTILSQYMLYLLVMYPFLLPVGIGLIRLRDTLCEARKFFNEREYSISDTNRTNITDSKRKNRIEAWEMLLGVQSHVAAITVKGDRSKSALFDACRVASAINGISDPKQKWEMVKDVWLEMLTYAASQGRGSQHGRQLRRGGELLTHVWLLMAHFGMTEQFQISKGNARAYLIAK